MLNGLRIASDEDGNAEPRPPKTAAPTPITGVAPNYEPAENEPAPDEETTESIISHASNVLQDSSMQQEDRLMRAYSEIGQFLENKGLISGHTASDKTAESRRLFDKFVSRKPGTWEQARKVDWNSLSPEQQAAIKSLPLLELPPDVEPMSNEIDQFFPQDKTGTEPIEWLVDTFGGGYFYVNTEGYTYARYTFQILNYPEETAPASTEGRVPMNASEKTATSDFAYKTELKTPDGYEIQSYSPYADPANARRFTVWPPEGNAVGDYSSVEEANTAIEQWKQFGNPELLKRDGGARFKIKGKTAGPMNVERPEQAFQEQTDKYAVHVAGEALASFMPQGQRHNYTRSGPSYEALGKVLTAGGYSYPVSEIFSLGYDDVSVEVPDQATAREVTDYLNRTLPKSNDPQGYGYGTAEPAQAAGYTQTSDQLEGDEFSSPNGWVYPESTL